MSWQARLLWGLALIVAGAASATWLLARSDGLASLVGVRDEAAVEAGPADVQAQGQQALVAAVPAAPANTASAEQVAEVAEEARAAAEEVSTLEDRIARLEGSIQRAEGSAGRADGLLIAFAARRAIDRGVALGYLEPLLVERFGANHEAQVATVITAARNPVRIEDLIERYQELGPTLRQGAPDESTWQRIRRELSNIVAIYPTDQPNPRPRARYDRALVELRLGDVSAALNETMRMPGAGAAEQWIADARRYVATRRALDRLESAALLSREENATDRN